MFDYKSLYYVVLVIQHLRYHKLLKYIMFNVLHPCRIVECLFISLCYFTVVIRFMSTKFTFSEQLKFSDLTNTEIVPPLLCCAHLEYSVFYLFFI